MTEFQRGDRVQHSTLGKGSFREYAAGKWPANQKSWVLFDDHDNDTDCGGWWIAVETNHLLPLSPGPKPEPYLYLTNYEGHTLVSVVDHYVNHANTWQSMNRRHWGLPEGDKLSIPVSEIKEALDE